MNLSGPTKPVNLNNSFPSGDNIITVGNPFTVHSWQPHHMLCVIDCLCNGPHVFLPRTMPIQARSSRRLRMKAMAVHCQNLAAPEP